MNLKEQIQYTVRKAASKEKAEVPASPLEPGPDLSLDLAEHQLIYQVKVLQQQLREAEDTHNLRLGYADKIFLLVCAWLIGVVIAVFMSGFNAWGFALSDKVLITFITSTTINIVGLFIVVAKWMFPTCSPRPRPE